MATAAQIVERRSELDTELVDWAEEHVISMNSHPKGWEVWVDGEDREPLTPEPVLYTTMSLREAWAQARAAREAELA